MREGGEGERGARGMEIGRRDIIKLQYSQDFMQF